MPPARGTRFIVGPPGIGLAHAARHRSRDLIAVDGVEDVRRDAAAVERRRHRHAVHRHAAFVGLATARAEERHRRRRVQAVGVNGHARRRVEQVAHGPRARNGRDDLLVEHGLAAHRLDVNDGRLAGDGDCFLDGADAHVNRDREDRRPGQDEAVALDVAEAWQRERQAVGAWRQLDDAVNARAVGDDGAGSPWIAGLLASTVTPGSTAPEASLTVPVRVPCAAATDGSSRRRQERAVRTSIHAWRVTPLEFPRSVHGHGETHFDLAATLGLPGYTKVGCTKTSRSAHALRKGLH